MNPITSSIPIIPGIGTHVSLNDSMSMSDGATSRHGLGIQKCGSIIILLPSYSNSFFSSSNLNGPPIISYDRGSSYSGQPSALYSNLSTSLPHAQQIHHDPQGRISTLLMASDRQPMYSRNPNWDESAPVSSSSKGNINEKNERPLQIPPEASSIAGAEPAVELTSAAMPGRHEENDSAWNSGYPQPLRFVPIV